MLASIRPSLTTPSTTLPQDPFERWAALQAWSTDDTNRLHEVVDLAFWERVAETYDRDALAVRVPAVLQRVQALVPPGVSLLDVGCGTGAFTRPLAQIARSVTALDYSPAMLGVLERSRPANVRTVRSRWEEADVEPHDVAFAANAFYRAHDLRHSLTKFVDAANRRGIVVWSIGRRPDTPPAYKPGPDYVHVVDGLFQLHLFANVEIVEGVAIIWWDRAA